MADFPSVAIAGAECLARLVDEKGRFLYRFDPDRPQRTGGYNILRHCGTIWAMCEVANRHGPLPQVVAAAERALDWLIARHVREHAATGARCLVGNDNVKLGGNGLAILALLEMAAATGKQAYVDLAEELASYVLGQRLNDGSFIHKRRYSTDEVLPFQSDYYTGEALFGLLKLHAVTGDKRWLDFAEESEGPLAASSYGVPQSSHWMLYTLEQLHRFRPSALVLNHAAQIAAECVRTSAARATLSSTQIACRTEGMLAFLRLLRRMPAGHPDAANHRQWRRDTEAAVVRNIVAQLSSFRPSGAFVAGLGNNEVRIDYIQHNISGFLGFSDLDIVKAQAAIAKTAEQRVAEPNPHSH